MAKKTEANLRAAHTKAAAVRDDPRKTFAQRAAAGRKAERIHETITMQLRALASSIRPTTTHKAPARKRRK